MNKVHSKKGLNQTVIRQISAAKEEPAWMLDFRLRSLDWFFKKPLPNWSADFKKINFEDLYYYIHPHDRKKQTWDDLPPEIKQTFEALQIPKYEREFLAGIGTQYDSEMVYHNLEQELADQGVVFSDIETALKTHPELVKQHFATVIPPGDNKFAALNSAVWSGGSFVYIPPNLKLTKPLQAYFRINAQQMGQFERTLIIVDQNSFVHYVEGCTSPLYSAGSLHSAVVEIIALPGSRVRYSTVQNWSQNVYNLVTKRALAHENATVEWVDFNMGSAITAKYPCVYLQGDNSRADILSMAMASGKQHQDSGGKIIHLGKNTTSNIIAKSISTQGGRSSYRGLVEIEASAENARNKVQCDALLLDENSTTDTYPTIKISNPSAQVEHEASITQIEQEQLFYLQSRGVSLEEARNLIINGFIEPLVKELPMEYAIEMNRLIKHQMTGSVG